MDETDISGVCDCVDVDMYGENATAARQWLAQLIAFPYQPLLILVGAESLVAAMG